MPRHSMGCSALRRPGDRLVTRFALLFVALSVFTFTGCASTWDTVSSRKTRKDPMSLFKSEEPMAVLRTKVGGGERAMAMRKLKEPAANGGSADVQNEMLTILAQAATADPSPVVRTAAIDALGRFRDPRAVQVLIVAYQKAEGIPGGTVLSAAEPGVEPAGLLDPKGVNDLLGLTGPVGFQPELTTTIRQRSVTALSQSNSPEAVAFLAKVAVGEGKSTTDKFDDREVRVAAVRGLGQMRQKPAVVALTQVLQAETGKDVVLASRAHEGLVELTGKNLPADPAKWNSVVQSGFEVSSGPSWIEKNLTR